VGINSGKATALRKHINSTIMEARETKIQPLIDGSKQYLLPLFQRKYVWDRTQWKALWSDIMELYEDEELKNHFLGSIVTIPMSSVPQGVSKYVLIDGQQRMTTLFILLAVLRDKAEDEQTSNLSNKINNTLLVNPYETNLDYYKLVPTEKESDRNSFINLIDRKNQVADNQITKAYSFFEREVKKNHIEIPKLLSVITQKLSLVSIVLHEEYDNPHLVFESLNSTGIKLFPSDLIRNYFFMRIHVERQVEIYNEFWLPMESKFDDKLLTEFIRHYLKKDGTIVKKNEIYFRLRERVNVENAEEELEKLHSFSSYYEKLVLPEKELDLAISKYLIRLNTLEVRTVYPFLLNCYEDYNRNSLKKDDFIEVLKIIENFLIRRYIVNVPTNQLDKIFPPLYKQTRQKGQERFIDNLKLVLQTKNYPTDIQLRKAIEFSKLYGSGDKIKKTKHLLCLIEESYNHKEKVVFDELTIEHIMPQSIKNTPWWKKHLGDNWEETHDLYLHTLGNLTLTAYNPELSNDNFEEKKKILKNSHIELNKYFEGREMWAEKDIRDRGEYLTDKCLEIWPYFGNVKTAFSEDVTGSKPTNLRIWDINFPVKYWVDVLELTVKTIQDLAPEKLEILIEEYPRFVNKKSEKFRRPSEVLPGVFVEKNYSAENIQRFCIQAMETIELTSDDWDVTTV